LFPDQFVRVLYIRHERVIKVIGQNENDIWARVCQPLGALNEDISCNQGGKHKNR
jgi:hypothetical protein